MDGEFSFVVRVALVRDPIVSDDVQNLTRCSGLCPELQQHKLTTGRQGFIHRLLRLDDATATEASDARADSSSRRRLQLLDLLVQHVHIIAL